MHAYRLGFAAKSCAILLVATAPAIAAEYTWTGPNNGQWSDAPNWTPTGGPPGAADTAVFTQPGTDVYNVVLPGGGNETRVGSIQVLGDELSVKTLSHMTITGTGPDALHIQAVDGRPGGIGIDSLSIPDGGITLSGATSDPTRRNWFGSNLFVAVKSLTILSGTVSNNSSTGTQVAGDVQVGNPDAARGATPVAFFNRGTVGGAVRVYPDGGLIGLDFQSSASSPPPSTTPEPSTRLRSRAMSPTRACT